MNCYTVNYLNDNEQKKTELLTAEWKLKVIGYDQKAINSSGKRVSRRECLDFFNLEASGLIAENILFYFSEGYTLN